MGTTTTQTSRSTVDLGPQSSLEELLAGKEVVSVDQDRINALIDEQNALSAKYGSNVAMNKRYKQIDQEIERLQKEPVRKRSGGLLDEGIRRLAEMGKEMPSVDYGIAKTSSKELADMFGEYSKTGGLPGQEDINAATDITKKLFSARRTALEQDLIDQTTEFKRERGRMGQYGSDPVATAKLRTGFMKQRDILSAEELAERTRMALGLPGERLRYKAGQADVLSSVADREDQRYQQGLSNLTSLLGVGNALVGQDQAFRLNTSPKSTKSTTSESGFGTVVSGVAGGIGAIGSVLGGIGQYKQGTAFSRLADKKDLGGGLGGLGGGFGGLGGGSNYSLGNFADQFRR